jgi:hypothetical protein
MENRNRLLVDFALSEASGTAERDLAPRLVDEARPRGFLVAKRRETERVRLVQAFPNCEPGARTWSLNTQAGPCGLPPDPSPRRASST